jgi:hypothetical protein
MPVLTHLQIKNSSVNARAALDPGSSIPRSFSSLPILLSIHLGERERNRGEATTMQVGHGDRADRRFFCKLACDD